MTNVLFILTDDQRFDTIAALGNPDIDTPHLDALVARGTVFTHAHIMGGTSPAVCMPSRAMLLTGRGLMRIPGRGQTLDPAHPSLPEHFRAAGYRTAHVGKWHQDRASHARGFSDGAKIFGFRTSCGWYEACNGHWHVPVHDFDPSGNYPGEGGYNDPPVQPFTAPFEATRERGRHSVQVFTDAACDFIRRHPTTNEGRKGLPFFLYLAHIAPHDPRQYPARLRRRYRAEQISLPPNFATAHPFDNGELLVRDELLEAHPRRPEAVRQHLADYYALISYIDEELGRLLRALEESGQAEDTLIVFAGDNGLAVGQHGLMGKQNCYDHSLRVPLIVAGPGVPAGERRDALCYLHDLYPTLCDLTGLPIPEHVESQSLVPCLSDPQVRPRELLHFAYRDCQRAVRRGDHKLIAYATAHGCHTQLFDLAADPYEVCDLSASPDHQALRDQLEDALADWHRLHGDGREEGRRFWSRYA